MKTKQEIVGVGDQVKIITNGYGALPEDIGKIVTVKGIDNDAYELESATFHHQYVLAKSFVLFKKKGGK